MNAKFEHIADFLKKHISADDYDLRITATDQHETRFAQNAITQHIAGENIDITLEVAFANKTGKCSINQSEDDALLNLVKSAEEMARLNQPDPEYVESQSAQAIPQIQNASPATQNLAPQQMVELVKQSIANAQKQDAVVSGMTEKHYYQIFADTKNGFRGYYDMTEFGHSMTLKKDQVETKVSFSSKDFATFHLPAELDKLNRQFASLGKLEQHAAGRIPVILKPAALMEFYWFMLYMMNRRQADEGFTPFTDQLGRQFMGEKFSLMSVLSDPELLASPFSWENVPSQDLYWVKNGVLENLPCPRYWAKQKGVQPLSPFNIYIPGGKTTEEEMLQMVPRGLIVNRFWYIRFVDMKAGELTGMTRDGVWYFENGKVQHAVNNLRFNEIPHDTTRRILALGKSELTDGSVKLPSLLIDNFNFVDTTSF